MGKLSNEDLSKVEKYLDQHGLTFKPLIDELMDHLIEDLENRLEQGNSFDEAWDRIKVNIPEYHFKTLQKEIMETIDRRFNLSRGFTYLSLVLLFVMIVIKLLNLSLSGILLLAMFGAMIASLLTGSLLGIYHYKEKRGAFMVFGVVVGITLFLVSFSFQILHLPGFERIKIISVVLLILFFPGLIVYFGTNRTSRENILIYLHEKHSPGIEQYLLYLFTSAVALSIALIAFGSTPDVAHILLVLAIGGAGLQYFALNWYDYQRRNRWQITGLVLAFLCFVLPVLTGLSHVARVVLTTCFYVITGSIVLKKPDEMLNKRVLLFLMTFVFVTYGLWTLLSLNIIDESLNAVLFNLPFLGLLLSGLVYFIKNPLVKLYMMMVIGHYMFEYPYQLGWW